MLIYVAQLSFILSYHSNDLKERLEVCANVGWPSSLKNAFFILCPLFIPKSQLSMCSLGVSEESY